MGVPSAWRCRRAGMRLLLRPVRFVGSRVSSLRLNRYQAVHRLHAFAQRLEVTSRHRGQIRLEAGADLVAHKDRLLTALLGQLDQPRAGVAWVRGAVELRCGLEALDMVVDGGL